MTILEVKDVLLQIAGLTIVKNVSFTLDKGAIHSLIGPNGAGKTSLFNCMTGFYRPTGGEIHLDKIPLQGLAPHRIVRLGLARTFQNVRLFKEMTVLENVMAGRHCRSNGGIFSAILRNHSHRQEEQDIHDESHRWLNFVGLGAKAQRRAGDLPYGDQRRLEWARALASEPKLLMLDEPAAGLTHTEKTELIELLGRIREFGTTVLLIEHDMALIMEVSDHVVVMDHGQMIAEGKPEVVQKNPHVIEAYIGVED